MRTLAKLLLLAAVLGAAAPAHSAAGAYAGAGSSRLVTDSGECLGDSATYVALYPSPRGGGMWAMEVSRPVVTVLDACGVGLGAGYHLWPSYVADNLVGTPEEGFRASGVVEFIDGAGAEEGRTRSGVIHWDLVMGPVGPGTTWSIHSDVRYDPGVWNLGDSHTWWNGTTDFAGAHVASL